MSKTSRHTGLSSVPRAVICVSIVGWVSVVVTAGVDIPIEVWAGVFIGSWIGIPIGVGWDAWQVRATVGWPHHLWAYLLGSVVWFLAVGPAVLYLWKRHSVLQEAPADSVDDDRQGDTASGTGNHNDPKEDTETSHLLSPISNGNNSDSDATVSDSPGSVDNHKRMGSVRQWAGFSAVVVGNLVPLIGVVIFGWSVIPLLVIYFCEAFTTALLAAVKALFAELGSPTELDTSVRLPLADLRRKRGSLDIRPDWPPVYPRNVPFSTMILTLWLIIGIPIGLVSWAGLDSSPVVSAGLLVSIGALSITHLSEFQGEYIGERRFTDTSAREIIRVPLQHIIALLLIFPFVTNLSDAGVLILGGIVLVKTVSEAYRYAVDRLGGPRVSVTDWLNITRFIDKTETQTSSQEVSVPDAPVGSRIRPNTTAVLLGSVTTVFFELLSRLGFGVIGVSCLVIFTGVPVLVGIYVLTVVALLAICVGSHYLQYGTVEYRRRGDRIVAYDRVLEEPQWVIHIYCGDISVVNAILDRLLGTGTLSGTAESPEKHGSVRLGPVDSLSAAVETLDLPMRNPSRPETDYTVVAAAAGLLATFAVLPLLILATGSSEDALVVAGLLMFAAPLLLGGLAWAALSRI